MDQAMRLFHEEMEKSIGQSDILEYLAFSAYMSGNIRRALKLTNQMLNMEPDHPGAGATSSIMRRPWPRREPATSKGARTDLATRTRR